VKTKDIILRVGGAVLLTLAFVFTIRACRLYDEVSVLKGKHEALRVAYADLDMKSRDYIAAAKSDIEARDKAIMEKEVEINRIRGKVEAQDKTIAGLEAEYVNLGENKDAKIANLQAQVTAWREKFTLAEAVIAEKDAIIFDMTAKYDAQVKISAEWRGQYQRQAELHSVALERIAAMEKEWRGVRVGSRLKTYAIAAVTAGLVYSLVKK